MPVFGDDKPVFPAFVGALADAPGFSSRSPRPGTVVAATRPEWLKSLPRENRRIIGEDIKTVQFGWPLGMPLVRKLDKGL